jgi:hypothetical protein
MLNPGCDHVIICHLAQGPDGEVVALKLHRLGATRSWRSPMDLQSPVDFLY